MVTHNFTPYQAALFKQQRSSKQKSRSGAPVRSASICRNWSVPKPTINDNLTNTLVKDILCNSFDQIVTIPTRKNNILDLVLCRNLDPLPYVNIIPPLIDTDHKFIQFCLPIYSMNNKVKESIYHRNFQKANYYDINEYIMNINWALELSRFTNVNDRYDFLQNLYTALDIFVPMKLNKKGA